MIQPPSQRDPIVDDSGLVTNVYQRWFSELAKAVGHGRTPAPPIPPVPPMPAPVEHGTIQGIGSIQSFGVLPNIVQIALDGDDIAPGQTAYYGTGQSADPEESHVTRGWHPVSGAMMQGPGLSLTIGADGVTTFALAELADSGAGTLLAIQRDEFGRAAGTRTPDTDDLAEGGNLYYTDARSDARITAQKGQPAGLATLDVNSKLDAGQLPSLAITETFVVNTESAMLALDVQQGDVAVRSDLQASFILTAEPASVLSNWQELLVPTGVGVASFNGRTGSVVPATGDYTPAQVGAADSDDARLSDSREWTAATVSQAEAQTGTATIRRAWTAQRVRQAIAAWWEGSTAKATLDGLITQTIDNGDIARAPSGDAVFDALAGKEAVVPVSATANFYRGDKTWSNTLQGPLILEALTPTVNALAVGGTFENKPLLSFDIFAQYSGTYYVGATITPRATAEWSATDRGTYIQFRLVANGTTALIEGARLTGGEFQPGADNTRNLGSAALRWKEVFAGNATINTSDAREKADFRDLSPSELAAAVDIARLPAIFRWILAIEEKGEGARLHASPSVQSVMSVMESHGLDPFRYGFVCYDQWDEQPETRDEAADEVTQEYRSAGDLYSLRPSELTAFVMRGLAHRQDDLESRLSALEG